MSDLLFPGGTRTIFDQTPPCVRDISERSLMLCCAIAFTAVSINYTTERTEAIKY